MTCTIIAAIVSCIANGPTAPKPTAAEAARIFAIAPFVYVAPLPAGPRVVVSGNEPALGPWPLPQLSPKRRLDGTLITDPPADYWSQPTIIVTSPHPYRRR